MGAGSVVIWNSRSREDDHPSPPGERIGKSQKVSELSKKIGRDWHHPTHGTYPPQSVVVCGDMPKHWCFKAL